VVAAAQRLVLVAAIFGVACKGPTVVTQPSRELSVTSGVILVMNEDLARRDENVCRNWSYSGNAFFADFDAMTESTAQAWGRECYQYACSAKFAVRLNGREYEAEVNAGGWARLVPRDGHDTMYFITAKRLEGFKSACDCCEE
jgi:hypothetical protein